MVNRKGIAHVMDAFAGIVIIFVFMMGSFTAVETTSWTEYENKIATKDLSYTLKETGNLEKSLKKGGPGTLQTMSYTVSDRNLQISGEVQKIPIELDIGMHTHPNEINITNTTEVTRNDRCYGELDEIQSRSVSPILRTEGGSNSLEEEHGGRLYLGTLQSVREKFTSRLNYNAVWVDNSTPCNFTDSEGPYFINESFKWTNRTDQSTDGIHYEFDQMDHDSRSEWNGTLELHQADKIVEFEKTLRQDVSGIKTVTEIDSFNLSDGLNSFDVVIFRQDTSLNRISDTASESKIEDYLEDNSALFLTDLQRTDLDDDNDLLYRLGFRWADYQYGNESSVNCEVNGKTSITSGCNLTVRFPENREADKIGSFFEGMKGERSNVSIYPSGSIYSTDTDILSSGKLTVLEDYNYENWEKDASNMSMEEISNPPSGVPTTACDTTTQGEFDFFPENNSKDPYSVVNIELGSTDSYCDSNDVRGLLIDLDRDGDYNGEREEVILNDEKVIVGGKEYITKIYSTAKSGCGKGECAKFALQREGNIEAVNFNTRYSTGDGKVGRISYEDDYSVQDRKLIASAIYFLSLPNEFGSIGEDAVDTSIIGNINATNYLPYRLNLRWGS